MNISIEGVNCSGKTTLEKAIITVSNNKFVSISDFFNRYCNQDEKFLISTLINTRPTCLEDELRLKEKWSRICLKRLKSIYLEELSSNLLISNRCILSFFVHGIATFQGEYIEGRKEFRKIFEQMVKKINFKSVPDYTIILDIEFNLFLKRVEGRERAIHHLIGKKDYFQKLRNSYKKVSELIGPNRCKLISGKFTPEQLAKKIIQKTKYLKEISIEENLERLERLLNNIHSGSISV